ncbi:MAG: HAD hydrolase family protein [Clostridiales bacterium]|nr:HAD hydrolase family protein [Clostridiales bacterium]
MEEKVQSIKKVKIPRVGHRILKSSFSVLLCFIVYLIRGREGIPFYSMLAALWCIRPYIGSSLEMALQRTLGTFVGAGFGLLVLLIKLSCLPQNHFGNELIYDVLVALAIIPIIWLTVLLHHQNASYFSCVVFLSIVVNHIGDENPYIFVLNRVLDTMIGIVIGIGINSFHWPSRKQRDVLFVSGIDDTLIAGKEELSTYSKREINYMLDDGLNFTISTMRTPASLQKLLNGIRLRLPIIAMDGAVLYDMNENSFIRAFVISYDTSAEILNLVKEKGFHCFSNVIIDDCLLIYYEELENEAERKVFAKLHSSPYRNYIKASLPEMTSVVYFMIIDETQKLQAFYDVLKEKGYETSLKILFYPSKEYPGYSYIKIYNKNACRENMLVYLKDMTGLTKTVTFGSVPEKYDVQVVGKDTNQVARTLRKMYEVPVWKKEKL